MKCIQLGSKLVMAAFVTLGFSSLASAQATRTWVSGVGDDANPCSRTAPCKTFAGAVSKTAAGGEIDCLDPGGFGGVTITKSITIDGGAGTVGSVLVSGTNGIVVTAGATDVVTIRNLEIQGSMGLGLDGIRITAGAYVHLENVKITGFASYGVEVATAASLNLSIRDCTISDTTLGAVTLATTSGTASADINNLRAYNTHPAILGGANSAITVANSDLSFGAKAIRQNASASTINVINCQLNNNSATALESFSGSIVRASGNTIAQNNLGVNPNGGTIFSDGTNLFIGNVTTGSFNGTPMTKM